MDPRLIVEVRWGLMNGRKVAINPGASLRVGRTDRADFEIPHDDHLSALHFALDWDGERCRVRDLGSAEGTLINGEAAKEGEVGHGGWIHAGETDFSIYIEDKIPPPAGDEPDDDELFDEDERRQRTDARAAEQRRCGAAVEALSMLRAEAERAPMFAILDAARDDRILELARQSVEAHQSLYEGVQGEPLATVAPYLVGPFRASSKLLSRLVTEGWGKRWGIYLTSREPFKEVRRHFRRFLIVEMEDTEEPLYFRYYDPWVLRVFLPTCSERQRAEFKQAIELLAYEGDDYSVVCSRNVQLNSDSL